MTAPIHGPSPRVTDDLRNASKDRHLYLDYAPDDDAAAIAEETHTGASDVGALVTRTHADPGDRADWAWPRRRLSEPRLRGSGHRVDATDAGRSVHVTGLERALSCKAAVLCGDTLSCTRRPAQR